MENNDQYDDMLKNLNERVSSLSKPETNFDNVRLSYNLNLSSIYYGLVPLLVYTSLYLIKPEFVKISDVGSNGQILLEKKLSHKKILIATIISTIFIWVSYFAYQYKNK